MKLLGILRASALFILVSAFYGQPVSCGIFKGTEKSKKSSNANQSENSEGDLAAQVKMLQAKLQALEAGLDKAAKESSTDNMAESIVESPLVEEAEDSTVESQDAVPEDRKEPHGPSDFSNDFNSEYEEKEPIKEAEKSNEEHEQHDVAMKTETDVTSDPSTINLSGSSKNPDGSMATPSSNGAAEDMEAEQEERLKEMQEISEDLKDSPVESSSELSSPAPKSNLVFENSKWDDSMLASTFVFINEFCGLVNAENFGGKVSEGLSKACVNVSSYMGSFIHRFKPTYGPGTVDKRKEIPMDFYKDVLKAEQFQVYVRWLAENNWEIWASVKQMFRDSLKLSKEQLKTETSRGPLRYGFVYTGKPWGELTHGVNRGFFKGPTILQSFNDLKSSLDKILKSFPKDSTVKSQAA
ncbi:secreted antigen 1 [Babesia divergens]|uniref:Secreted antigen 1 n=1 Tax=Babesia divergens TaxID=32595 RepID=A0AAD9LIH6_BABDI|nr:secreted antigen 1 [Babesia divergens]